MSETMSSYVVSDPTAASAALPTAPGAAGPAGNMSMRSAILWLIGGTAGIALTASYLGRKGKAPQIGHLDVIDSLFNAATVAVWFGTAKVVAYRYHGHKLSQAVLMVL